MGRERREAFEEAEERVFAVLEGLDGEGLRMVLSDDSFQVGAVQ